jgi:hypothetical protein
VTSLTWPKPFPTNNIDRIPARQRIISWTGFPYVLKNLGISKFEQIKCKYCFELRLFTRRRWKARFRPGFGPKLNRKKARFRNPWQRNIKIRNPNCTAISCKNVHVELWAIKPCLVQLGGQVPLGCSSGVETCSEYTAPHPHTRATHPATQRAILETPQLLYKLEGIVARTECLF